MIHGCYLKSEGSLRIIDASVTTSKATETAVDCNQQGQQAPRSAGPKGDTGATGATGPKGDPGAQGPKGDSLI